MVLFFLLSWLSHYIFPVMWARMEKEIILVDTSRSITYAYLAVHIILELTFATWRACLTWLLN
jgi:hypothetical protein